MIVVPLGTHTDPGGPALLLPPRASKLPGTADMAEGALLAESAALSRLVRGPAVLLLLNVIFAELSCELSMCGMWVRVTASSDQWPL